MATEIARRAYDSTGRRAQAHRNRDTILSAARTRFLTEGYAATTMASIAEDAGLSIDTVHKAFRGKAGLVRAIYERSLGGEGAVTAPVRSDDLQQSETDPRLVIGGWGELASEVAPLVVPIHLLVRDAAVTDSEMASLLLDSDAQRRDRMRHNARTLADRGQLKPGLSIEGATDVMWTYSAPEMYDLLVIRCGWSAERYGRFVGESLTAALLA